MEGIIFLWIAVLSQVVILGEDSKTNKLAVAHLILEIVFMIVLTGLYWVISGIEWC